MTVDDKRFNEIVAQFLDLPERIETTPEEENWAITFAALQPISVTFNKNEFTVSIRGSAYMNEGRDYPGMNVAARYRIENGPHGLRAYVKASLRFSRRDFSPTRARPSGPGNKPCARCSSAGSASSLPINWSRKTSSSERTHPDPRSCTSSDGVPRMDGS